jgi:hypothetical protein
MAQCRGRYARWGAPSDDFRKGLELSDMHLRRVKMALAWAREKETRCNHWNNLEWILQLWHLEMSLLYCGLDRSTVEEKMSRMELSLLAPIRPFFLGTKIGPPPCGRNKEKSGAGSTSFGLQRISWRRYGGRKRVKVEGALLWFFGRAATTLNFREMLRKSDRLKGKCTLAVVGSGSSSPGGGGGGRRGSNLFVDEFERGGICCKGRVG